MSSGCQDVRISMRQSGTTQPRIRDCVLDGGWVDWWRIKPPAISKVLPWGHKHVEEAGWMWRDQGKWRRAAPNRCWERRKEALIMRGSGPLVRIFVISWPAWHEALRVLADTCIGISLGR